MLINSRGLRIFLRPGVTDLRKHINGLFIVVKEEMNQKPESGNLFLFCNRKRNLIKILYWDKNGFCLWLKKLEGLKFPWPKSGDESMELDRRKLLWLLQGVDFFNMHRELIYKSY
jgi:transposase